MKPALGIYNVTCGVGVLVVAQHDIVTLHQKLANIVLAVVTEHIHLCSGNGHTAGAAPVFLPVHVGDERCTLGTAVTHGVGEPYLAQDFLNLRIQGCAAND